MDGKLIKSTDVEIVLDIYGNYIDHYIHRESKKKLYVDPEIREVIGVISSNDELWQQSEILLSEVSKGMKRIPILGPSFQEAFQNVFASGKSFSWFYYSREYDKDKYIPADMCMLLEHRVDESKGEEIWFETWSFLGNQDQECFYTHAIYNKSQESFRHFDAAKFQVNEEQKVDLKNNKIKPKGSYYRKVFVINGSITFDEIVSVTKAFLPFEELTKECLEGT